jgi:ABC-2 type transport system ATP-binding protein/lipopolysaccharide transport system ATP-binding protein
MATNAIELDHVSKRYRLGEHVATGRTLRDALSGLARHGRERKEEMWSVRDITLSIEQGDAIGIIGRNGAGKTTLLRIVTRITEPTSGVCRTRGRVGSLLEVGTGFHPDLTGRENVYLNGAILGMPKREVRRRFDEIIDFAGVERFVDTPVKRYSSGMYLRLAFAVAAHLDADIMVVDEVLAVGDAEFQAKCLGKMAEIEGSGRTVLFVSHNLDAVIRLCPHSVWLDAGSVRAVGATATVVEAYLNAALARSGSVSFKRSKGVVNLTSLAILDAAASPTAILPRAEGFTIEVAFDVAEPVVGLDLSAIVSDMTGRRILDEAWSDGDKDSIVQPGHYTARLAVPPVLNTGEYTVSIWIGSAYEDFVWEDSPVTFRLEGPTGNRSERLLQLLLRWQVQRT